MHGLVAHLNRGPLLEQDVPFLHHIGVSWGLGSVFGV